VDECEFYRCPYIFFLFISLTSHNFAVNLWIKNICKQKFHIFIFNLFGTAAKKLQQQR